MVYVEVGQPGNRSIYDDFGLDIVREASLVKELVKQIIQETGGILPLAPNWVPRSFCVPGRRLKLRVDKENDDYFPFKEPGHGGLDERWRFSTQPADNGPLTFKYEGMDVIPIGEGKAILLEDAIIQSEGRIIGKRLWEAFGNWPMYSKFFDNKDPLPHHIHQRQPHADRTGKFKKPEAYYFPPQANNHDGSFPYTFFGLRPGTTRAQVRHCLERANAGEADNGLTKISQAYELQNGTGWDVPPGILHAPGSLCTSEPQARSDVFGMYEKQKRGTGQVVPENLLWKDVPEEEKGNIEYLLDQLDWDENLVTNFAERHYMEPVPVADEDKMLKAGYYAKWVCYKSEDFSEMELTVLPGKEVTIKDSAAYGFIMMQGHGTMQAQGGPEIAIESPTQIIYGQLTNDVKFVMDEVAQKGVTIRNHSDKDPIVMLKSFGPQNPDLNVNAASEYNAIRLREAKPAR